MPIFGRNRNLIDSPYLLSTISLPIVYFWCHLAFNALMTKICCVYNTLFFSLLGRSLIYLISVLVQWLHHGRISKKLSKKYYLFLFSVSAVILLGSHYTPLVFTISNPKKDLQAFSDCLWRGISIFIYCDLLKKVNFIIINTR